MAECRGDKGGVGANEGRAIGRGHGGHCRRWTRRGGCEGPKEIGGQPIAELVLRTSGDGGDIKGVWQKRGRGRKGGNIGRRSVGDYASHARRAGRQCEGRGVDRRGVHRFAKGCVNDHGVATSEGRAGEGIYGGHCRRSEGATGFPCAGIRVWVTAAGH